MIDIFFIALFLIWAVIVWVEVRRDTHDEITDEDYYPLPEWDK